MKARFSSSRKVVRILLWPILVGMGQFLIVAILSFLFMQEQVKKMELQYPNESESQIIERVNQLDISIPLNDYVSARLPYVILWNGVILMIIVKKYQQYKIKQTESLKHPILFIISPIAFCILFHIIFIALGLQYEKIENYLWLLLCSECLLGPILEEYLFRGFVYHELQKIYPKKNAMFFCTVLFALFHGNLLQILFAFLLGTILIFLYEKYQNIKIPIIFHIIVNFISVLVIPHLHNLNSITLIFIFLVCILLLIHYFILNKNNCIIET